MDNMTSNQRNEWFRNWFDSPYYHILYRHRDESEARLFLDNLLAKLQLKEDASILDLACGRGRHAVYLESKGYDVTGVDLSEESIATAKKSQSPTLHFEVQDMRTLSFSKKFDCIVNLFTSFGYFSSHEENLLVLRQVKANLVENGIFVLDYFNPERVTCHKHEPFHEHQCGDIKFLIRKSIHSNEVIKDIFVEDHGKKSHFQEYVQLLRFDELKQMIDQAGLTFMEVCGNYELQQYDPETSDRMIIIARN